MYLKQAAGLLVLLLIYAATSVAHAHVGLQEGISLSDGFMHTATGLDHLLLALAAGYCAASCNDSGVRYIALFMILFATGIVTGFVTLPLNGSGVAGLLWMPLVSVLIAIAIGVPGYLARVFFGMMALYQGMLHVYGMPSSAGAVGYCVGLLLSTFVLVMFGMLVRQVVITRRPPDLT